VVPYLLLEEIIRVVYVHVLDLKKVFSGFFINGY
jgi:hypothetical protein